MFNRHNEPLSIAHEFKESLDIACRLPLEWLCCEGLERRHKIGQGSLIILDAPIAGDFASRKSIITAAALGNGGCIEHTEADVPLENNRVYLPLTLRNGISHRHAPIHAEVSTSELLFWEVLKASNVILGCEFWEGVVCDKDNALFQMQLRSAEIDFPFSTKHRWKF